MQPKKKVQMAEVDITVNSCLYEYLAKMEKSRIKSLASLINNQVLQLSEKIGQLGEARMIIFFAILL